MHHSVPLEMLFHMVSCLAKVKFFRFWPKTMDGVFTKIEVFFCTEEGAMKLKFASLCSS